MLGILESYFEHPEDLIAFDESHEETRYAELSELNVCDMYYFRFGSDTRRKH